MAEFIRRFLLHILPKSFHRHYGLLAGMAKVEAIAKARDMLMASATEPNTAEVNVDATTAHAHSFPCCGGDMTIIEVFEPGCQPQHRPVAQIISIDTS